MTEAPADPQPELVTVEDPWGGPVFRHHGAEIRCVKGGHVWGLVVPGHPLDGVTFGVPGTITHLGDAWIRDRRLPGPMRVVPKPDAGGPQDRK